jgi:hypothetical protein
MVYHSENSLACKELKIELPLIPSQVLIIFPAAPGLLNWFECFFDDDKFATFVLCKFLSLTDASSATAAFRDSKNSQEAKLEYLNLVLASFMEGLKARFTVRVINGTRSNVAVFVVDDLRHVTPNRVGHYSSLTVSKHFDSLSEIESNVVQSLARSSSQELNATPLTQDLQPLVTPSTEEVAVKSKKKKKSSKSKAAVVQVDSSSDSDSSTDSSDEESKPTKKKRKMEFKPPVIILCSYSVRLWLRNSANIVLGR